MSGCDIAGIGEVRAVEAVAGTGVVVIHRPEG
jgi:hypothetical protein